MMIIGKLSDFELSVPQYVEYQRIPISGNFMMFSLKPFHCLLTPDKMGIFEILNKEKTIFQKTNKSYFYGTDDFMIELKIQIKPIDDQAYIFIQPYIIGDHSKIKKSLQDVVMMGYYLHSQLKIFDLQ